MGKTRSTVNETLTLTFCVLTGLDLRGAKELLEVEELRCIVRTAIVTRDFESLRNFFLSGPTTRTRIYTMRILNDRS